MSLLQKLEKLKRFKRGRDVDFLACSVSFTTTQTRNTSNRWGSHYLSACSSNLWKSH